MMRVIVIFERNGIQYMRQNRNTGCFITCNDENIEGAEINCLPADSNSNCNTDDDSHCVQEIKFDCNGEQIDIVEDDSGNIYVYSGIGVAAIVLGLIGAGGMI